MIPRIQTPFDKTTRQKFQPITDLLKRKTEVLVGKPQQEAVNSLVNHDATQPSNTTQHKATQGN
jgi:hypothetical protein